MSSQVSLDEWVEQRYARPVVLLESSAAADAVCARHGLDTIQLLRPHSVYTGGPLSARTSDRSDPVTCNQFGVRLMRTDCVRDVSFSQVTRHVRRLMRSSAAIDMAYGEQLDSAVESIVQGGRSRHDGSLPHPVYASAAAGSAGGPSPPSTLLERACPTWHRTFVRDFHSLVRCSSFDTVDHPVGVLFAVATSEAGGVEGILQIFRAQAKRVAELKASLPGMDSELHQYYLILHDNTAPTSPSLSTARQVLTAVQQLYGANYCALIKVNSVVDPRTIKSLDPSLWVDASPAVMDVPSAEALQRATVAAASATSPSSSIAPADAASSSAASTPHRNAVLSFRTVSPTCGTWPNSSTAMMTGCYMSPEDVAEVQNVMSYYLSQSLFKYVERRLRMLDVSVQDRRTTTLGKMAAWFKGKDEVRPRTADVIYPPNGSDPSVLPKYVASSLEMQMRHCGDLSLVLHDYEGAITYYRLCIDELLETLSQRPYNRAMIAACQEGLGVAQFLQRRAPPPSLTPWYTGVTSPTHRISSQTNRWEVAWNDYRAAGTQTYAVRIAFLIYECCRTRLPPLLDRCRVILLHLQRSGVLQRQNLLNGIVNDMLAGIAVFSNAPYAAGLTVPPPIPRDYPMLMNLRRFARYLQQAGAFYRADNSLDQALRCYLRVLELFRLIDPEETWKDLAEHLYLTVGQLYTQLGQDVRGIAMASAAVAQGTPLYRRTDTAQHAFEAFWAQQKRVLGNMGYALCPHMPMPRIIRASFHVDRNYYNTDSTTDEVARRMSETVAEAEWRGMEKQLKTTYAEAVLKFNPQYRFPALHGGFNHGGGGGNGGGNMNGGAGTSMGSSGGKDGGNDNGSRSRRRFGGGAGGGAAGGSTSSAHYKAHDYIFADAAAPGEPPRAPRHYKIARAEPLVLSFVMENTIGCLIEATDLTLLYLSYNAPEQLWKSSSTQTVRLAAGARQRVSLSFDPIAEGEYAIIGLCWSLMGQEGYYYFATRESRPGCPESLYEYAIEHPMPTLEAVENIHVTVQPSKACVTATFHPHLPDQLFDGEYFHTKLVVHNTSTQQDATHVFLQRSPNAAHLLYVEEFGLAKNLDFGAPLVLADHLKAQETRTFAVTVRGQHRRGDVSLQSSGNYIFILLAYLPGAPQDHEKRPEAAAAASQPRSTSDADATSLGTPATESMPVSDVVSPTFSADNHHLLRSPTTNRKFPSLSTPPVMVRLHRLLRRCDVQPALALFSTVLPPANASLKAAVVLTVKNICASHSRARTASVGSGLPLSPTTSIENVQAIPVATASQSAQETAAALPSSSSASTYTPLRIARVLAVHSSRWDIECNGTTELTADGGSQCLLAQGDCLTFALLVKRRPRGVGTADTTARHLFLHRAARKGDDAAAADCSGTLSPYTDTTCLPLHAALPSPSRIRNVETHLGTTVSQFARNLFFLQTSCLGPGRIGAQTSSEEGNGGLAFYADKAGQQKEPPKSAEQQRRDEVAEERRLCGAAMEQYTPLALAVTWVREGSDGLRKGQLFLFVDPIEHIYQTVAQQQKRQAEQETAARLRPAAAAALGGGSATASVEQTQQELCEAMLVRYSSLKPWQGAVVSHVHVPPTVKACHAAGNSSSSGSSPTAAIPVTLRCMSLAPVPLLVTAEALTSSSAAGLLSSSSLSPTGAVASGSPNTSVMWEAQRSNSFVASPPHSSHSNSSGEVPVLFVGKTVHTFLLMPSDEFEVKFTAHALRPGIVDCQRIALRAASICFLCSNVEAEETAEGGEGDEGEDLSSASMASLTRPLMRTGMTLPTLIRALLERRAPASSASMTTRVIVSAQCLFENGGRQNDSEDSGTWNMSAGSANLDHWKTLARSPHGSADPAAASSSVTTLVERYGPRAVELLHQLSPRGPAASATVSQVIPQTTPALSRVVLDDAPFGASSITSVSPMHAHEMVRRFLRQLDAFEAEVQRAVQASSSAHTPVDPFLQQYVYRPTVKALDGRNSSSATGAFSANNSLTMTRSAVMGLAAASSPAVSTVSPDFAPSPASLGTTTLERVDLVAATTPPSGSLGATSPISLPSPAVPYSTPVKTEERPPLTIVPASPGASVSCVIGHNSNSSNSNDAARAPVTGAASSQEAGTAKASGVEGDAAAFTTNTHPTSWESAHNGGGGYSRGAFHTSSSADAGAEKDADYMKEAEDEDEYNSDAGGAGDGDPASPLHLPAVAFERRAAEAAETQDISENTLSESAPLPRRRVGEQVPGEGMHMHDNSFYGAEGEEESEDFLDSALATNTLSENASGAPLLTRLYEPDVTEIDRNDEAATALAHRHSTSAAATTKAKMLLVPSTEPLSSSEQTQFSAASAGACPPSSPVMKAPSPAPQRNAPSSSSSSSSSDSDSSSTTATRNEAQHLLP